MEQFLIDRHSKSSARDNSLKSRLICAKKFFGKCLHLLNYVHYEGEVDLGSSTGLLTGCAGGKQGIRKVRVICRHLAEDSKFFHTLDLF